MGQVFLTGKEAQERAPLLCDVIADRALQHRIRCFYRVEHQALRNWSFDLNLDFVPDVRQSTKMLRKFNSNRN